METVYIMARRNYKIAAYIGLHKSSLARFVVVLDTGAGSSFIRQALIPESYRKHIKPLDDQFNVKDANNRRVVIAGTINLTVQVGKRREVVKFNVVERLGTDVILGCDYCDKHVESIRPRKRLVELDDGSTVPILKRPEGRATNAVPLPAKQEYVPPERTFIRPRLCRTIGHTQARSPKLDISQNTAKWFSYYRTAHASIQNTRLCCL